MTLIFYHVNLIVTDWYWLKTATILIVKNLIGGCILVKVDQEFEIKKKKLE